MNILCKLSIKPCFFNEAHIHIVTKSICLSATLWHYIFACFCVLWARHPVSYSSSLISASCSFNLLLMSVARSFKLDFVGNFIYRICLLPSRIAMLDSHQPVFLGVHSRKHLFLRRPNCLNP
nr:hypothetical protein Iba_chr03cCG14240 [Ipomoea batatas]